MDTTQITPQLHVGSYPASSDDIARLKSALGITAILCMQTDEDFDRLMLDPYALAIACATRGIEYHRVPVRDFDPDSLREQLPRCVQLLADLLTGGHRVLVHCTAGQGRSATAVVAYFHWVEELPLMEAAQRVTRVRACSPNLEAISQAAWPPEASFGHNHSAV